MQKRQALFFILLMSLLVAVLAACGGDDSGDDSSDPLPTSVVNDDDSADTTPDADVTDEAPVAGPPGANNNLPPFNAVPPTGAEVTPPVSGPGAAPGGPNGQNVPPFANPGATSQLPFDPNNPGGPPGSEEAEPLEILTDFSDLPLGVMVRLQGTITTLDTTANNTPVIVIEDEQGNRVEIGGNLPVPMLAGYEDTIAAIEGTIAEGEGDMLIIRAVRIAGDSAGGELPNFLGPGGVPPSGGFPGGESAPPGTSGTNNVPNLPQPDPTELDFTVEANLTALQAYDALVENVEGLADQDWLTVVGNPANQWVFEFQDPETETSQNYIVGVDGSVFTAPPLAASPVPGAVRTFGSIERDQIVLDSSDVLEIMGVEDIVMGMSVSPVQTIVWSVPGRAPIDATVAP